MSSECPRCECDDVHSPSFTWWGGAIGARVLRHSVCRMCGFGFNAKTRASNRIAIVVYTIAMNAIVLALMAALTRT